MEISDKKIEWPCRPAKTPRRRTAARAAQAQKPPHRPPSRRTSTKPSGGRGVTGARPARFKNHSWCWLCRHSDQKCSEPDSFFTIFMWNRALATVSCTFCRSHLAKVLRALSFFTILCDQPLDDDDDDVVVDIWNRALATVSCTFCQPHLPKVVQTWQFFCFLCEIELWLQSCAHFADLIFPKASRPLSSFTVTFFNWKSSSRYSSVHCLLTTFPDRSANHARKQRPLLRRPRQPLYPKKHRVSRPREFSSLNSLVPDLLDFPTTWWWCICHDDVVDRMIDMMMWLPQWWESWPWQSSVTRKFPN